MVAKIADDTDVLVEYFKYLAERWVHLRRTNPTESPFATVRLRTRVTKGLGERPIDITPEPSPDTPVAEVA